MNKLLNTRSISEVVDYVVTTIRLSKQKEYLKERVFLYDKRELLSPFNNITPELTSLLFPKEGIREFKDLRVVVKNIGTWAPSDEIRVSIPLDYLTLFISSGDRHKIENKVREELGISISISKKITELDLPPYSKDRMDYFLGEIYEQDWENTKNRVGGSGYFLYFYHGFDFINLKLVLLRQFFDYIDLRSFLENLFLEVHKKDWRYYLTQED